MACIFYPSNPKTLSTSSPVDSRSWRTLSMSKPLITDTTFIFSLSFLKDLENPKTNTRNAGFTKEERQGFTELLEEGFIDSFRLFILKNLNSIHFGLIWETLAQRMVAGKLVITRYYLRSVLSILKLDQRWGQWERHKEIDLISKTTVPQMIPKMGSKWFSTVNDP